VEDDICNYWVGANAFSYLFNYPIFRGKSTYKMNTIKKLILEKEETDRYVKELKAVRNRFVQRGDVAETDFPIDEMIEFRKLVLDFIDEKLAIGKDMEKAVEQSLSFYEY
jgi:hypothetical protein